MTPSRILVVDDDRFILEFIALFLRDEGYTVDLAHDGQTALDVVERDPPNLVLLDMRMPIMDGWKFAAQLAERNISLPIVVMTAAPHAERVAREISAMGWIAKPFTLPELRATIRRCFKDLF